MDYMTDDIKLTHDGERIEVNALTENGSEFLDAYTGPLLEVRDSGHIIIPREALADFIETAQENAVAIEPSETTTTERDVLADVIAALDMYQGTCGSEATTIEDVREALEPPNTILLRLSNGDEYALRVRAA